MKIKIILAIILGFIVGVAWKVWKSVDPYTGEYRKGRFWKNIRNN